jgi:hypothetical protein
MYKAYLHTRPITYLHMYKAYLHTRPITYLHMYKAYLHTRPVYLQGLFTYKAYLHTRPIYAKHDFVLHDVVRHSYVGFLLFWSYGTKSCCV